MFVSIFSCPVNGHHFYTPPGCLLFTPSLPIFLNTEEIPLSCCFSGLNSPSSRSLLTGEMLQTISLGGPSLIALQYLSPVLGRPELDTALQVNMDDKI